MSLRILLDHVRRDVQRRRETDYVMPLWLPFLPLIILSVSLIILLVSAALFSIGVMIGVGRPPEHMPRFVWLPFLGLGLFGLLALAAGLVNIYVVYKWVDRRNKHFRRTLMLYESLRELLARLSAEKGVYVGEQLQILERDLKEYSYGLTEKNPVLWALLQVIPWIGSIILFYVYHFLNKDFLEHYRRESYILGDIGRIMKDLNLEIQPPSFTRDYRFPDRSTVVYIVATILTLGLFSFYWVYTLTKDPNEHFKEHSMMEEPLIQQLEKIVS